LILTETQVTDLTPLKDLHHLKYLDLEFVPVSDVTPLNGLKNLRDLVLFSTKVTKQQVKELKRILPDCSIASDF
ncbi:MAG: hypothetical protein N2C14_18680, partial [Planctomycetales bacterium]